MVMVARTENPARSGEIVWLGTWYGFSGPDFSVPIFTGQVRNPDFSVQIIRFGPFFSGPVLGLYIFSSSRGHQRSSGVKKCLT